ncbi:hypothetical protein C826_01509 [Helicobacter bilis WiWa]|uniref:DUF4468 domain-containing protein n=2 Tax=Helicobacter bilis TaxID=37372 RepID=N2BJ46_9HELI|nr:hypothetical protein [Helicobacter bilis]EMZ38473.1 hypothetical protein C826_01509 [Helicobacter bilis WiWa]
MRYVLILMIFCNSLFAQIETEKNFTDTNITKAYEEMQYSFSESYYLPQSIESMKNITQTLDYEKSEIYGYESFKIQWQNENEVSINLNAFNDGEKICTYRSYILSLKQVGKDTRGVIESIMLYPQDIDTYIQNACECNYFRGEYGYDEARNKELDRQMDKYCKPLPQDYKILQEKYNDKPKLQRILKRVNEL